MINHKLKEHHIGQPVIVFLQSIANKDYGKIVSFTNNEIMVSIGNRQPKPYSYQDVTLDIYSVDYTAPEKNQMYEEQTKTKRVNNKRLKKRLNKLFKTERKSK